MALRRIFMKKFGIICLIACGAVFAEEVKSSHGYVNVGIGPLPIPAPQVGLGWRYQNGHHGLDALIQLAWFYDFAAKQSLVYLHYFNPNTKSQFYEGIGIAFSELFDKKFGGIFFSPEFVIGNEFTTKRGNLRFVQAQIDWPFKDLLNGGLTMVGFCPGVSISYGICF